MSEEVKTLREMKQRTLEACSAELATLLEKHGCALKATPFLNADGRIEARVELVVR